MARFTSFLSVAWQDYADLSRDKLLGSGVIYHLLCHLAESLQPIRSLSRDWRAELNILIRLKTCHMTRYGPVLLHA